MIDKWFPPPVGYITPPATVTLGTLFSAPWMAWMFSVDMDIDGVRWGFAYLNEEKEEVTQYEIDGYDSLQRRRGMWK